MGVSLLFFVYWLSLIKSVKIKFFVFSLMWMIFNLRRVWKFTRKIARKNISNSGTGRAVQCPGARKYCFPVTKKPLEKHSDISLTSTESAHFFLSSTGMRFVFICRIAWVIYSGRLDHYEDFSKDFITQSFFWFDLTQISLAWLHFTFLHFFFKLLSLLDFDWADSGTSITLFSNNCPIQALGRTTPDFGITDHFCSGMLYWWT